MADNHLIDEGGFHTRQRHCLLQRVSLEVDGSSGHVDLDVP